MIIPQAGMTCIVQTPEDTEIICKLLNVSIEHYAFEEPKINAEMVMERTRTHFAPFPFKILPCLDAKKVIFNPPATVVLWKDGTKTVVKCGKYDAFDEITGVSMCYMKKALGNKSGTFNKALRAALKEV